AARWLPEARRRKPSLENLAAAAGVPFPPRRGALRDARVVVAVAGRALEQARSAVAEPFAEPTEPADEAPSPLRDTFRLGRAPDGPGVYVMRDAAGAVLYVGRSVSLRKRLLSYASGPLGFTRQLEGLLDAVAAVKWQALGSELEAMLAEARLLREHAPR